MLFIVPQKRPFVNNKDIKYQNRIKYSNIILCYSKSTSKAKYGINEHIAKSRVSSKQNCITVGISLIGNQFNARQAGHRIYYSEHYRVK